MTRSRNVAIVCFLPDAGHVLPLLRLGRVLQSRVPCQVTCFVVGKFAAAVREQGFELREILTTPHWPQDLAAGLARKSIFYNAFSGYIDLSDHYWIPLRYSASQELPAVIGALRLLEPQLLICDDHVFGNWYTRLAASCGARLIINRSEGTLRWQQRAFVRAYGLNDLPAFTQALIETLGTATELGLRIWRKLRHPRRSNNAKKLQTAADENAEAAFGPGGDAAPVTAKIVSCGLAALEQRIEGNVPRRAVADTSVSGAPADRDAVRHEPARRDAVREEPADRDCVVLAPTIELQQPELPQDLADWLTLQAGRSVVYVSFGTMIALSREMFGELLQGLIASGAAVIWSLPQARHLLDSSQGLPGHFRIEESVPQPALLASDKVGCFLTHGGAGSTQEAVVFGKPALCVPFMWDQPYNCSLLVRLGMARELSKRQLTRHRVCAEIRALLDTESYATAAKRRAVEIRELLRSEGYARSLDELSAEVL